VEVQYLESQAARMTRLWADRLARCFRNRERAVPTEWQPDKGCLSWLFPWVQNVRRTAKASEFFNMQTALPLYFISAITLLNSMGGSQSEPSMSGRCVYGILLL
jgi:hypothetical protein